MNLRRAAFSCLVILLLLTVSVVGRVSAQPAHPISHLIEGTIIDMQGPRYTIKQDSGQVVVVTVDERSTRYDAQYRLGDHITAEIHPRGYALFIVKSRNDGGAVQGEHEQIK